MHHLSVNHVMELITDVRANLVHVSGPNEITWKRHVSNSTNSNNFPVTVKPRFLHTLSK